MEEYVCIRLSKKSGKIDKILEGLGCGMLKLWALQNTKKTKNAIIFSKADGRVIYLVEGTECFPVVHTNELGNIKDICPELWRAVQEN